MNTPCKNCKFNGCGRFHDKCEKYKEWKEMQAKEKRDKRINNYVASPYYRRIMTKDRRRAGKNEEQIAQEIQKG